MIGSQVDLSSDWEKHTVFCNILFIQDLPIDKYFKSTYLQRVHVCTEEVVTLFCKPP